MDTPLAATRRPAAGRPPDANSPLMALRLDPRSGLKAGLISAAAANDIDYRTLAVAVLMHCRPLFFAIAEQERRRLELGQQHDEQASKQ